jgi:hypothetical protein
MIFGNAIILIRLFLSSVLYICFVLVYNKFREIEGERKMFTLQGTANARLVSQNVNHISFSSGAHLVCGIVHVDEARGMLGL